MTIDGPGSPSPGGIVGGANVGALVMPARGDAGGLASRDGATLVSELASGGGPPLDPGLAPADAEGLTSLPGGVVALAAGPDGTTAAGSQLANRLLAANSAMSAPTARTTRPMARRRVLMSMGWGVYVTRPAGQSGGPRVLSGRARCARWAATC